MSELARRSGLNTATLQEIESGETRDPSVSLVVKIARALGVAVESLCSDESTTALGDAVRSPAVRLDAIEQRVDRLTQMLRGLCVSSGAAAEQTVAELEELRRHVDDRCSSLRRDLADLRHAQAMSLGAPEPEAVQ